MEIQNKSEILKGAKITSVTNMGAGVCRAPDGRVVFVYGAVDGDIADVQITRQRRSYLEGVIKTLIEPSPYRQVPDCAAFVAGCGGCMFRHISYEHELTLKRDHVASAFARVGLRVTSDTVKTAGEFAPRCKFTVPVMPDGSTGYYKRASKKIVPTDACPIHGDADKLRIFVADYMRRVGGASGVHHICVRRAGGTGEMSLALLCSTIPAWADDFAQCAMSAFPSLRGVFARTVAPDAAHNDTSDDVSNSAGGNHNQSSRHKGGSVKKTTSIGENGGNILLKGEPYITDILLGCRFRISPASFYQVNHDGAEILYKTAAELIDLHDGETLLDLYCGTGTVGISVIKASGVDARLIGVEIFPAAVDDACENARMNGVGADFICGDASSGVGNTDDDNKSNAGDDAFTNSRGNIIITVSSSDEFTNSEDKTSILTNATNNITQAGKSYSASSNSNINTSTLKTVKIHADAVIINPPRSGCGEELARKIAAAGPSRVVYISCNPNTLARDAAAFVAAGYTIKRVIPVDMFPRTGHVECVTLMSRVEK